MLRDFGRRLLLAIALAVVASCAHAAGAAAPRLVAYVAGWERQPAIQAQKLSAINFAFAHVVDGAVVLDHAGDAEALRKLVALKLRNPRLRILVSVGGWGADGFSDAALDDAARERFARSAAELVDRLRLDGLDIDWEYPGLPGPGIVHRDADRENFTRLLQAVRARFDRLATERHRAAGEHYLLTAALADAEFVAHVELAKAAASLDWINLMTYDFHNSLTPTTGHHSGLRRSKTAAPDARCVECAVAQFLDAGVPRDKLVVGVPFYARVFADVNDANHGLDQRYGRYDGEHPWPELQRDFIGHNGFERHWDAAAQEPYLWNAATRTFVSYDDPQSLKLKAAFVRARRLGGIMYWEQSQDPHGELLGVLAAGLGGGTGKR